MSVLILAGIVVAAVAVFVAVASLVPQAEPGASLLEQRLGAISVGDPMSPDFDLDEAELAVPITQRFIFPIIDALGNYMLRHTKQGQLQSLRQLIVKAGSKQKPEILLAQQIIAPIVFAIAAIALASFLNLGSPLNFVAPVAGVALGYAYPTSTLKGKAKKRGKQIVLELPGILDLLTISMEAGLSLDMSMMRVCDTESGVLAAEFRQIINEVRLGRPRAEAMMAMAERNDVEELTTFIRSVVQAEPLGVSIANVLQIQSEELRRLRRQRAEEAGHRAPVLMLLPMMGCIFPCIFLMLLGPAALTIIATKH